MGKKESVEVRSENLPSNKRLKLTWKMTYHGLQSPITEKTPESKEPFIIGGKDRYKKIQNAMHLNCFMTIIRVLVLKLLM